MCSKKDWRSCVKATQSKTPYEREKEKEIWDFANIIKLENDKLEICKIKGNGICHGLE